VNPVEIIRGNGPVILGQPHCGTFLPPEVRACLNEQGRLLADTDWHVDRLYDGLLSDADDCARQFPSLRHRRKSRSLRAFSVFESQHNRIDSSGVV
jgi:hypothetical protein